MSDPVSRLSPEPPSPDDVPQWITDLVPIADYARALLREGAPMLAAAAGIALIAPQLVHSPAPWMVAVCGMLGGAVALRHGGRARGHGASLPGGPGGTGGADASDGGAGASHPAPGERASTSRELRAGGRTGAQLAVLDILLSATGLAALAGMLLAGSDQALLIAVISAAAGLTIGIIGVAVLELVGRRGGRVMAALAAVVTVAVCAIAYTVAQVRLSWWWVLALAVAVDVAGLLALRAGHRADREAGRTVAPPDDTGPPDTH
ncbi:hypothetical protein [Actinomyces sp. MRS3W]|uniref:hypothetical protein n=1 Tax=Actinomyces sp. MRS3W TaxID=2800796 RepID=UPI0028FD260A|nr:hypothetical protein [Actinomyces sp. MRS3W]MDU0347357.1 hypothetical protein [Actinomyces sp. MRS3W]